MGSLHAAEFAEAVNEGLVSIDQALHYHLVSNHYPPIPTTFVPVCKEAIGHAAYEDWDELVDLPEGCTYKGEPKAPVWAIVEQHHLDEFVAAEVYRQNVEAGDIEEDDDEFVD